PASGWRRGARPRSRPQAGPAYEGQDHRPRTDSLAPITQPVSKERRRIISAATVILVVYALSRLLGYVRDVVIANTFGTSQHLDDYQVAFRVPDLLFNLLLAGAISSAFIPVLSEHLALGEASRAREIAERVLNSGILILTAGAALLWLGAPLFVNLTAYG